MRHLPVIKDHPDGMAPVRRDSVHTLIRLALFNMFEEHEIDPLMRALSLPRLRTQMVALGICEADADDLHVARLYFSGRCRIISPNDFFDETWYCERYADVAALIRGGKCISGFIHFMKHGITQGLWPNQILHAQAQACMVPELPKEALDEVAYVNRYPGAGAFLAAFPSLSALDHYNLYGRFLGYNLDAPPPQAREALSLRVAAAEFDSEYYIKRYLAAPQDQAFHADPFDHYLKIGMKAGHSPNSWFQEDWYRAFYQEVREAIKSGMIPSGFYHYLMSGRIEGRLPKYDLAVALEARMPGVTNPVLIARADMLKTRLAGFTALPKRSTTRDSEQVITIFLPTLNPDIMYGGYKAVIELVCALRRDGRQVAIVCHEEKPNLPYFLWSEKSAHIRSVFAEIPILDLDQFLQTTIGHNDLFVAYTVWDLPVCARLASLTENPKPLLLAQEYEPIFYDNGAQRALCEACYRTPHYPVINSHFLLSYFIDNKIGAFSGDRTPRAIADYAVFEHKINCLVPQTAASMRDRASKVMAIYARPEAHAARNLFELILIALKRLCAAGKFGPEWSFIGMGALTKMPPIPLGGGHELQMRQKMSEEEYRTVMSAMDIGVSLMYAPHPSVVPFEFATTGALVVTNTYENRSAEQLQQISANIVPCEVSVESLMAAIERAASRLGNVEQRERHALHPKALSWPEIFSPRFIGDVLSSVSVHAGDDTHTIPIPLPVARKGETVKGRVSLPGRHRKTIEGPARLCGS